MLLSLTECNLCNFPKIFPSPKMAAILNFRIFAKNGKTQICFYLLAGVSKECNICRFSKKFPLPKNGGHFEFSNFCQKWQNTNLLLRDRAISSKFSTHRVSKECNLCNFPKIFPSPKMAAILNFRIFAKNGKTQICFYLLNRAR